MSLHTRGHKYHPIPNFDFHVLKLLFPTFKGLLKETGFWSNNLLTSQKTKKFNRLICQGTNQQVTSSQPITRIKIQKQDKFKLE